MGGGFLYSASFMMDAVVCVLLVFVPLLAYSIYLVAIRQNYAAHRRMQIWLASSLFLTVIAFEVDMRLSGGWREIVAQRAVPLSPERLEWVGNFLKLHLVFAISTTLLWIVTFVWALRKTPNPPGPSAHSRLHRTLGWISSLDLVCTTVSGTVFYYFAFIVD